MGGGGGVTRQPPWAYCEIPGDTGARIRQEGGIDDIVDCSCVLAEASKGRPGLDPRAGESVNLAFS